MKLKYFLSLFWFFSILQAQQVIMIMGPSCAGKSTLAQFLCKQLKQEDEKWIIVDFDDVGEDLNQLVKTVQNYMQQGMNVIVDTNTYEKDMEKSFGAGTTIKVVVTAPLNILLQRDEKRTQRLRRNKQRAFWCKHFVIESFKSSLTWPHDLIIDSSEYSIQKSCDAILGFLKRSISY